MNYFEGANSPMWKGELIPDLSRRERFAEIVKETIRDLYNNARYWEFFKTFNEESVHEFITEYASRKAYYLINGSRLLQKKEREQFRFRDMAENCLWEIQQKKLFNLQAEWRAGLIELDQVEVTRDFYWLEKSIRNCSWIPPVTSTELNLYMDYLESGYWHEKSWFYHWQDYESIKNSESAADVMPAWYRYYDEKTGSGYLMMLPDKKGEEEKKYLEAWRRHHGRENALMLNDDVFMKGDGPDIHVNYETLDFFIRTFENNHILRYFEAAEKKPKDQADDAMLQESLRILQKADTAVKLPQASDWREAVIRGAATYKTNQIFANLPIVFDEYLFRIKSGISFPETEDEHLVNEYRAYATLYRNQVAEGKRLSG